MRKIPATMATQHPDNAGPVPWLGRSYVDAAAEVEECYRCFAELGCEEYMWDWEGKFVDEAVVDRLFQEHLEFFRQRQLGRDIFLTVRVPNIWQERGYRITRAFMGILTAHDLAADLGLNAPPLIEVILPMTGDASQLLFLKRIFRETAELKERLFDVRPEAPVFGDIGIIPLIEGSEEIGQATQILRDFVAGVTAEWGAAPDYIRPFIARSDPALNSGMVSAVLLAKVAMADYYRFQDETGIAVYPIIGVGSLPFRGGLSPHDVSGFLAEYRGLRTVTVQSGFRYDYPPPTVDAAIARLNTDLARTSPVGLAATARRDLLALTDAFAAPYRATVEATADTINAIAAFIPGRRERLLHVGLFGYSRGVGRVRLPRAIAFAAALYSLGVPPELIGAGRGLAEARRRGLLGALEQHYVQLRPHLRLAGRWLNRENLDLLCQLDAGWEPVKEDVAAIEAYLGEPLGPRTPDDFIHRNLTSNVYFLWRAGRPALDDLERAAVLRCSLG